MKTLVLSTCCALACSFAIAQEQLPNSESLPLARRLVIGIGMKTQFEKVLADCIAGFSVAPASARDDFKRNPAHFGGISPQSTYWTQIEAAYALYSAAACRYLSADDFSEFLASEYAGRMSISALRAAVGFYDTPEGAALRVANTEVASTMQRMLVERSRSEIARAEAQVKSEIRRIVEQYRKQPQ